jgi:hypothetical protein
LRERRLGGEAFQHQQQTERERKREEKRREKRGQQGNEGVEGKWRGDIPLDG